MKKTSMIPSQPIFANLISGCLKANKVNKAWEIFDSMRLSFHQPDEVSFTLMLHACAKMQETYGFQPDGITYNTLLTACARKKDLGQARNILRTMWSDVEKNGSQSLLAPDSQTFTNLFWCYASYIPSGSAQINSPVTATTGVEMSTQRQSLPLDLPNKRSKVVKEAQWIFSQLPDLGIKATPALLTAYLALHISQKQTSKSIDIYTDLFEKFDIQKDAFVFQHMLQYSYNNKDSKMAWKVWEDYQDFLEARRDDSKTGTIIEQKTKDSEKNALAIKEGWTGLQQQKMAALMANTLARSNDLKNALTTMHPPKLRDMMPLYNKCIQLEDLDAKRELVYICVKEPRNLANSKYKRVNN
ncbi:uncharacterized protein EV154DRAFT_540308 [Mucor mucedo]|uniref:uncharacterized protein n=1 Tax=Mucor mucedo TaxID=29922 RepID=UPI002220E5A5|nr:uncharacterized protein EV154DRAFT_540308 [Mucor mucedo]KAI7876470.1 hypothetical protein EV154DRAFT_540308 [Mucor mucedo]